jgi:hypothetical protein
MDHAAGKPLPAFGFLTVLDSADHGLFGGYLVLSPLGRPLEFRCSTPVAPSRAQQILYGPTLRPYLLSEVIGQTLIKGSELPVGVILTDQRDVLPLALLQPEPVLYVEPAAATPWPEVGDGEQLAAGAFDFAGCRICAADGVRQSADELQSLLAPLAARISLCEPFGRILAALHEAQLATGETEVGATDEQSAAAA